MFNRTFRRLASRFPNGFTLVELIVVITILAILATIGFIALSGYAKDARSSVVATNVQSVYTAITAESAVSGNSPRYYVVHDPSASLVWGLVFVDGASNFLTGGDWNQAGTNYSAGNPDYVKLKLNKDKFKVARNGPFVPEVFAAYDSNYLTVGSADVTGSGSSRTRSFVQAVGIDTSGKVSAVGNYPVANSGSVSGLVKDPSSSSSTGALVDGATVVPSTPLVCNVGETIVGGVCKDPYSANVSMLMHFENDYSYLGAAGITVTNQSSTFAGAGNGKFGDGHNGQGTNHAIKIDYNSALEFGSSDFTIEFWFKSTSPQFSGSCAFGSWNLGYPLHDFCVQNTGSGTFYTTFWTTVYNMNLSADGKLWNDSTWHYFVFQRNGTSAKVFIDGATRASATVSGSVYEYYVQRWIGRSSNTTSQDWTGGFDELRITKGVARYPSWSPAIPVQAFAY